MPDIPYGRDYPDPWPDGEPWPIPDQRTQPTSSLTDALTVFTHWLHLEDTAPVIATAAAIIANLTEGDPVWLLLVGPPSGGKTEILSSLLGLDYIIPASTITEAALLSGTPRKERAKGATGGLMRQIGGFGVLQCKDFTSVLSQNRDTARAAMAALREVYDERWDRPVGSDGARVLHWQGKCGFIGGVVPSYDRYQVIVNTLGDRFMLLRMPVASPARQARVARQQAKYGKQMRAELREAMTGLIASADVRAMDKPIDEEAGQRIEDLAIYAARARTTVERDGYTTELEFLPQPEGPARLVKAMCLLYGALVALRVDEPTRWDILARIAVDGAPAVRIPLIEALLGAETPERTANLAEEVGLTTKTASRLLDDLTLIGLATRRKQSSADNSADLWAASGWLRENWPLKVSPKCTTTCHLPF